MKVGKRFVFKINNKDVYSCAGGSGWGGGQCEGWV